MRTDIISISCSILHRENFDCNCRVYVIGDHWHDASSPLVQQLPHKHFYALNPKFLKTVQTVITFAEETSGQSLWGLTKFLFAKNVAVVSAGRMYEFLLACQLEVENQGGAKAKSLLVYHRMVFYSKLHTVHDGWQNYRDLKVLKHFPQFNHIHVIQQIESFFAILWKPGGLKYEGKLRIFLNARATYKMGWRDEMDEEVHFFPAVLARLSVYLGQWRYLSFASLAESKSSITPCE